MQRIIPRVLVGLVAAVGVVAFPLRVSVQAQQPAAQAAAQTSGQTTAQATGQAPAFERASDALERVSWRTRTLVGDERLTRWKLAIRPGGLTFLDAVVRADALLVDVIEGVSTQRVSAAIQKPLDQHLTAAEIATIRGRMGTVRMLTYRVDTLGADAAARRPVLQFAKAMGADTIVVPAGTTLDGLAALADEAGINVAVLSTPDKLAAVMTALQGQSPRLGVGIDTGAWLEAGRAPSEALAVVGDRLRYLNLRDRAARGASSRNTRLGEGAGQLDAFFQELNRRNIRPLAMTLDTTGIVSAPAEQFLAVNAFEKAVQPAYGRFFTEYSKSRPIRWDLVTPAKGETLTAEAIKQGNEEARRKIEAALPKQAFATPKKARTLLVIESLHGMSHNTIPHTNVMLERFGANTGAYKAVFSNDLTNLTWPKITTYDGIFLNSIVGEAFADPAVREGLLRFVREGGGLIGIHGTPWASRNWDEFADMIGAQDAPHRIEQGIMHVYDQASPIVKPLGGKAMNFKEEYYRFYVDGSRRLRWNDVRVLLTVDLDDLNVEPRPWPGYTRPDKIYPVSWIRNYGKGRVFYTSIGHMPETFMTPELVGHFLAGVQFALGDLAADATPNPPGPTSVSH
jgi:type 1 glutamine amidotransferase/sugar phosphate isomerase/epimerase